jgi:hypothetical protein
LAINFQLCANVWQRELKKSLSDQKQLSTSPKNFHPRHQFQPFRHFKDAPEQVRKKGPPM